VVLVGGHEQLEPFVSDEMNKDLKINMFKRIFTNCDDKIKTTLNVQYRMYPNIAYLPSLLFSDGQIGNTVETERERNQVKTLMQEE